MYDVLLARYGNGAQLILDMSWREGYESILYAMDQKEFESIHERWINGGMGYDAQVDFNEFVRKANYKSRLEEFRHPTISEKPEDTITRLSKLTENRTWRKE